MCEFGELVDGLVQPEAQNSKEAAKRPKLGDRWITGCWVGKSSASDEHYLMFQVEGKITLNRVRTLRRRVDNKDNWVKAKEIPLSCLILPWAPTGGVQKQEEKQLEGTC